MRNIVDGIRSLLTAIVLRTFSYPLSTAGLARGRDHRPDPDYPGIGTTVSHSTADGSGSFIEVRQLVIYIGGGLPRSC
ncbi:MAG: hypothetical protein IPM25_20245 [Chloracidobacterium sp.]|nr:hypothetical protein [Chloracidobacterium sp.]